MEERALLTVENLHAQAGENEILKGLDLVIRPGEVHAIMGPNGSGRSTLANVLAGHPTYEVTEGSVDFDGHDLLDLDPEIRAAEGVFLAFQYPVEIPGVSTMLFLKTALNSVRKHRGEPEMDAVEFIPYVKSKMRMVEMDPALASRSLNEGFSGGEKKRAEVMQMAVLEPRLAVLDETDSGLDIDALRTVANGVNALRDGKRSFLVITHYQRLLDYIVPDFVHVMSKGRIIRSGGRDLALELERLGYGWIDEEAGEEAVPALAGGF